MPEFTLHTEIIELELRHAFTISRGTKKTVKNVVVRLSSGDVTGMGEAAPNRRYNEDADHVISYLETVFPDSSIKADQPEDLFRYFNSSPATPVFSARAAVEMAWWDWLGKSKNQPLWKLWGHENGAGLTTTFTIGIDDKERVLQKVKEAKNAPVLKIKLGSGNDEEMIRAIRSVSDQRLMVDANEGWTTLDEAKDKIRFLADHGVELVEQPMPAGDLSKMIELKKFSPLPLIADESFRGRESLQELSEGFDGINIKLMKIGSMHLARTTIQKARELNLKVMIGCMIESSLAVSAGALVALSADFADLDGNLLISNDPFRGVVTDSEYRLQLPGKPGLGVIKAEN